MSTDQSGAVRKRIENYSYLMNQSIGKGYSSTVYRGRNDLTNQTVAIKVIDMKMIKGEVHKNLLASQIEVLKSVKNCENIIQVHDIFVTKNNTYIITELCEGGDLSKLISHTKPLPQAEAIRLMNQIIKGYCNLYSLGILHRDLKPANIFLKNNMIKIADFGFAIKQIDCKKYSSYNVGSPVYMPPEALNQNRYSYKSDIWALGVIYYEMLTGKTPWRAKTQKQLGKQLNYMPIKKLIPSSISESSETFLVRTLAVNVNARMSPEQLQRFILSQDSIKPSNENHFITNSIFDGRNNNIRGTDQGIRTSNRRDTSIARNNFNAPASEERKATFIHPTDQFNIKKEALPQTAGSISNYSERFISINTNQTVNNPQFYPPKQVLYQSVKQALVYDKKYLSKQLLSQIHFCRFLFKLIIRMHERLSLQVNQQLRNLTDYMASLIFEKLQEIQSLNGIDSRFVQDYRFSQDFHKINQIINQYQVKYSRELANLRKINRPLVNIKDQLTKNIIGLYERVEKINNIEQCQEEVIVLDYLVTLRQLIGLQLSNDMQGFHIKSKIEIIVEGSPSKKITFQHLEAIRSKLKVIRII